MNHIIAHKYAKTNPVIKLKTNNKIVKISSVKLGSGFINVCMMLIMVSTRAATIKIKNKESNPKTNVTNMSNTDKVVNNP